MTSLPLSSSFGGGHVFISAWLLLEMESELAQVKFPGMGEEGAGADDDEGSECEATKAMVASQNRKGRKSGGFQSMGERTFACSCC